MTGNKVFKNATWIIACKIIQSIVGLVIGMLTARYLGPSNFGIINYAASIVAFAVPIMQLGLNNILVQEFVNDSDNEGTILGTALIMSLCSSILCIVGVLAFAFIANANESVTIIVCGLYSIILFFQGLDMVEYWYQAKLLSKYTAPISLIAYFIVSLYKFYLLATGKSIYWFAVSNAFDYAMISVALLIVYKKLGGKSLRFSKATGLRMFNKSKHYIISSLMVTIFAQTDRIMIKLMVGDAATGYYSAAVNCAMMTSFVFAAIIDSSRPSIFESKKNSVESFERNLARLYSIIIYFALIQSVLITILAGPIIKILYGSQYSEAIDVLRIVVWFTTFSYMGSVRNIWILAENQQHLLWIINICGALANVGLNAVLIPMWGVNGAAFASIITQFFTNVVTGYILKPIRPNNTIIIRSLNPKYLIGIIKMLSDRGN